MITLWVYIYFITSFISYILLILYSITSNFNIDFERVMCNNNRIKLLYFNLGIGLLGLFSIIAWNMSDYHSQSKLWNFYINFLSYNKIENM